MNRAFLFVAVAIGMGLVGACAEESAPTGSVAEHIQPSTLNALAAGDMLTLDLAEPDRVFVLARELSPAERARVEVLAEGTRTALPDWLAAVAPELELSDGELIIAAPGRACSDEIFGCAGWLDREGCGEICFAVGEGDLRERAERNERGCAWTPSPRICHWDCPAERHGDMPFYEEPDPPVPPGTEGSAPASGDGSSGGGSTPSPAPGTTTPPPGF